MFFYVDESGHTGANLFDDKQPMLYYGVLSSKLDIDLMAVKQVLKLRKQLDVTRLHAAELGGKKLALIINELIEIQEELQLVFDIYRVAKLDHALISFFDQVFDQGLNPAVPWMSYWTPMRYILLLKVSALFDEDILKKAWAARIELNNTKAERELVEICSILSNRVGALPDKRSREIITDALRWVGDNPAKIGYNVNSKEELLWITPNLIGFQFVMHGIASRISKNNIESPQIVVDQQSQFNKSQRSLADFFAKVREKSFVNGPGLPEINFSGMPTVPIKFMSSNHSVGLELVDIYLWIFKRFMECKYLEPELFAIIETQLDKSITDEVSLEAIARRWSGWFAGLPKPTEEQIAKGKEMMMVDEKRRLDAIKRLPS